MTNHPDAAIPRTMPGCPTWCDDHQKTDHVFFDETHDGTPVRFHAEHFTTGQVTVWVSVSEYLTPHGVLYDPPVVEIPDMDYYEFNPEQARALAAVIVKAAAACESIERGERA